MKGMGEGGAVAPPAAIANAVRDALAPSGGDQRNADHPPPRADSDSGGSRSAGALDPVKLGARGDLSSAEGR